jgi:hypothetical protein
MVGVERFELRPSPKHYATNLGMGLSTNRKNRVLRAPATTFVITHSPSRSNDRDGLRFFRGMRGVRPSWRAWTSNRLNDGSFCLSDEVLE